MAADLKLPPMLHSSGDRMDDVHATQVALLFHVRPCGLEMKLEPEHQNCRFAFDTCYVDTQTSRERVEFSRESTNSKS
jgi:hypothetical protein